MIAPVRLRPLLISVCAAALILAVGAAVGDARRPKKPRKPKPQPTWVAVSHPRPAPHVESAAASCGHALTVLFHRELGGDMRGNADAVRYTSANGAILFASGSHQFAWGLDDFSDQPGETRTTVDPRLQAFMKNALDAMTR